MQGMKVQRILLIEQLLRLGPETIDTIWAKLKQKGVTCSKRSVYRDLLSLEEHFSDLRTELQVLDGEFNRKQWVIVARKQGGNEREDTYFKTFVAEQLKPDWMRKLTGNALKILLKNNYVIQQNEFRDIASHLPPDAMMHTGWGEYNAHYLDPVHVRNVLWGITNKRMVRVSQKYHSKQVTYLFSPYRIIYHRGTLHAAGWINGRTTREREFGIREIDLFDKVECTNERFYPRQSGRVADRLLKSRFGIHDTNEGKAEKIRIELGDGPGHFLSRRQWHHSQRFTKSAKGTWYLDMECTVNIELVGWIFSWLEHAKVIRPASLRKLMQERAEHIAAMYREDLPPVNPQDTNDARRIGR